MAQSDVLDYLKRAPESWVTYDELERNLGLSPDTLRKNIRCLVRSGEVVRIHSVRDPLTDEMRHSVIAWIKLNV